MPDPTTTNLALFIPLRGADIGTWDTPVNANMSVLDGVLGGSAGVAVAAADIVLSAGQYQNLVINFTGNLTADITVTFPGVGRFYMVSNTATSSGNYVIKMKSGAGNLICSPPGETVHIVTDATNVNYVNLARIGTYWDYGGSSVPRWVTQCSVPPYLNCDGTTFSSAVYPVLRDFVFGGNTLPDLRGSLRAYMNQTTSRINSSTSGIDGNTLFSRGGADTVVLAQANLPNVNLTSNQVTVESTFAGGAKNAFAVPQGAAAINAPNSGAFSVFNDVQFVKIDPVITPLGGSGTAVNKMPPVTIGGLTLVRAG